MKKHTCAFWVVWFLALASRAFSPTAKGNQADPTTAIILVGIALASYGAALALRKTPKTSIRVDNTPTTLIARGFRLQLIIGRRMVGGYMVWAGNRTTTQEATGGRVGKGGRRSGSSTQTIYHEEGIILLATGPIDRLHAIYQAGEVLWRGPIDRFNTPSGTNITVPDGSTFQIFWGEHDQPIDTWASDPTRLAVGSRWPFFARINWKPKRLGTGRTWPELRFDAEGSVAGSELGRSPAFFQETDAFTHNDGPNAAHAIYQFLTAPHPHGAGSPPEWWDFGSIEALGELLQAEQFPVSIHVNPVDGTATVADVLTDLVETIGFVMPQVGDVVVFKPIRYVDPVDIPVFDQSMLASPNPEREFEQGQSTADHITYLYMDRNAKFTRVPVDMRDDAEAGFYGRRRAVDKELTNVIDATTARMVANRRELEQFASGSKYTFTMNYTGRELTPGAPFTVTGFGTFRVGTVKMRLDSQLTQIIAAFDQYSLNALGWDPGSGNLSGAGGTPALDLYDAVFELPSTMVGSVVALGVGRIRSNAATGPASVWISVDGTTYEQVGVQSAYGTGGILLTDLPADTNTIVEEGPVIQPLGPDIAGTVDLTGDRAAWFNGRLIALIGSEFCLVRSLTAVTGGRQLTGLIRGRAGTVAQNQTAGTIVHVFEASTIAAITGASIAAGRTIFVKVQPNGVSLADCPVIPVITSGRALAPLPCDSLRQTQRETVNDSIAAVAAGYFEISGENRGRFRRGRLAHVTGNADADTNGFYFVRAVSVVGGNTRIYVRGGVPAGATASGTIASAESKTAYRAGEDINLSWAYRKRDGGGLTAGEQPFGSPVPLGDDGLVQRPIRDGAFEVDAMDVNGVVKRSWTIETDDVYPWWTSGPWNAPIVYSQADRTTDFGTGDPVIRFRVRCVSGAYASPWREETFSVE